MLSLKARGCQDHRRKLRWCFEYCLGHLSMHFLGYLGWD